MKLDDMRDGRRRLEAMRAGERNITVVLGPPCSGKTTFVADRCAADDVVIDFDALAVALGSPDRWDHSPSHLSMAHAARDGVIARALRAPRSTYRIWVIVTERRHVEQLGLLGAPIAVMDTPLDECERRAVAQGRTAAVVQIIRNWRDAG